MSIVTPTLRKDVGDISTDAKTLTSSLEFTTDPIIILFGYNIGLNNLVIKIAVIIITAIFWYIFGLFSFAKDNVILQIIFACVLIIPLIQIFTSSYLSGSFTLETSKVIHIDQMLSALLGSVLIYIYIYNNILITNATNKRIINYMFLGLIFVILIMQMHVNVKISGSQLKSVHLAKESAFNMIILTLIAISSISLKK